MIETATVLEVLKEIFGAKGVHPLNEKAFWQGYEAAGKSKNNVELEN
ncbi:hypothetical protein [Carboxydothermus pertinax]|uniref:Uncharacterized protein n=1 Tax=Carboxydothermus pertinax TaxID=870242 RepID=A0A1L8CTV3_9THEO|nr:hypothetical protein [Carboxydothermus pertinax]GAV22346.1 hypothetical protein cpu_08560 [Carboxydothermus pertinax]